MTPALRQRLLAVARRHAGGEAEDVLQEALIVAHRVGRLTEQDVPWLAGVIRRQAAMGRRSAARRARREREWVGTLWHDQAEPGPPLPPLPPSLDRVARLALAGCTRAEIRWLLDLPDTALRQRLAALRLRLAGQPLPPQRAGAGGARRAELQAVLARRPTTRFASHDPDGHLFLVTPSRKTAARQHTGETS
ncbi:hypothetical protein [Wenxinia marina]|uniref:Sigma-70 region 2 n=1 Tax=Wenxinia marina DSM 24838 TaxID=1123501 RepID=A0A0D0NQJ0_9RHOB|nr:hypothetical protein [Wenxinia marina]KIQ70540.1 Sigma-70 region 2 [Wenxinia marina DSM 24838]GGL52314.1 ECF subfamily RNA polymerase sigma-24 factor [Wenxinia marina]